MSRKSTGDELEQGARVTGGVFVAIGLVILLPTLYGIVDGPLRVGGLVGNCGLVFGIGFLAAGAKQLRGGLVDD